MIERPTVLRSLLASGSVSIGQISIVPTGTEFVLSHRDDTGASGLRFYKPGEAREVATFDDAGAYRPLRTAPNLRHGWRIIAEDINETEEVIDAFYPGRLAVLRASVLGELTTTTWRDTLQRQSGIYRVAARISDAQSEHLIGNFCRSDSGCLRTILWKRDATGAIASAQLPPEKFDPTFDQTGRGEKCVPLLCQEPCNLLVAAAREVVKAKG